MLVIFSGVPFEKAFVNWWATFGVPISVLVYILIELTST